MTETVRQVLISRAQIEGVKRIPRRIAEVLATAHQVAPEWHVRIQAAFQSNVDNAVSKTVNLPADATVHDVEEAFQLAYSLGCKGVTVYRDNSRQNQVFSVTEVAEESDRAALQPRPRARVTAGKTSKFRMGCGTLFVTVNKDDKGICEVFANLGKAGGCPAQSEATCRAVSAALRSGVDPRVMIDQLGRIRCLSAAVARNSNKGVDVLSCPDAIARALQEALEGAEPAEKQWHVQKCPECGQSLHFESGCDVCDCGYSSCG